MVEEFGEIGDWNVGAVTNMEGLFAHRWEFNEDLSRWDTSSVETMQDMFYGASSFNQPVEAWDTSRVKDQFDGSGFDYMFPEEYNQYPTWW